MASHEDQLFKAFGVTKPDRTEHFCKKVDTRFLKKLNKTKPQTIEELADIWYKTQGYDFGMDNRYNATHYHALNLHALFCPCRFKAIEFRFGQFCETTSMDWTTLEAFIRICLAMNDLAKTIKTASSKPQQNDNPRYAFRCWLLSLGFIGGDAKAIRKFLLSSFEGDAFWRRKAA